MQHIFLHAVEGSGEIQSCFDDTENLEGKRNHKWGSMYHCTELHYNAVQLLLKWLVLE